MITLQDAIERAKLATDNQGLLASYTYDRLLEELEFADRHAFTMALVDLGIVTKHGSVDDIEHMKDVLGMSDSDEMDGESFKEASRRIDIIEEFVKVSQQFVQGPGGLWVPDTMQDAPEEDPMFPKEEDPEDNIFDQMYEEPIAIEDAPGADQTVMNEFMDYDVSDAVETLEGAGIHLTQDGKVNLYSQNIPGLFMDQVPTRSMSMDQATKLFSNQAKSFSNSQSKIMELQDVLSAMNSDFTSLEQSVQDLISRFNTAAEKMDTFKSYSPNSNNEVIKNIGNGIKSLKEYLNSVDIELDEELVYGLNQQSDLISELQGDLDNYLQSQYESYEQKVEVVDALERLRTLRAENPEGYVDAISSMGGVTAMFKEIYR